MARFPKIISLFCGAGGLDLGFKLEGFKVALAVDFEKAAIDTHKRNFSDTQSLKADLTELGPSGVLKLVKRVVRKDQRLGIIGGPPCQGFSRSNPNSDPDDPRNFLPALYVEIIAELKKHYLIDFVVFENVLGMKDKKHFKKFTALIQGLKDLDFAVDERELCALAYGVPQNRKRIIISAIHESYNCQNIPIKEREGVSTVKEAIGGLVEPIFFERHLTAERIPFHPNHWTMRPKSKRFSASITSDNKTRSFRKLNWERASPTIAFGNREIHVHPDGKRRLSIYEAMLLQGFPHTFVLEGNLSQQVTQISNAVPPPLAQSIAEAVKFIITNKPKCQQIMT